MTSRAYGWCLFGLIAAEAGLCETGILHWSSLAWTLGGAGLGYVTGRWMARRARRRAALAAVYGEQEEPASPYVRDVTPIRRTRVEIAPAPVETWPRPPRAAVDDGPAYTPPYFQHHDPDAPLHTPQPGDDGPEMMSVDALADVVSTMLDSSQTDTSSVPDGSVGDGGGFGGAGASDSWDTSSPSVDTSGGSFDGAS